MSQAIREIDLHGKNVYQARQVIEASLRKTWGLYRIRLIHGYNQGSRLRDFIQEEYSHDPRLLGLKQVSPGVTDLIIKEL